MSQASENGDSSPHETTFSSGSSTASSSSSSSSSESSPTSKISVSSPSARARSMISMLQKYGYDLEEVDVDNEPGKHSSNILQLRERKNMQNALHIAVKKGHVDVLKVLMTLPRVEEFVNISDKNGNTPLHFAASKDNADVQQEMSELLLSIGADVQAMNVRGQTPLEVHIVTAKVDTIAFAKLISLRGMQLNSLINGTTYLHMAIGRGYFDMAGALVHAGASINIPDHDGVMVSDNLPHKALIKLIKYMREGTQAAPIDVVRNVCKLCKKHKGLLDHLRDCYLCGRTMCHNCSQKLGDVKNPEEAKREKLEKEALASRLCTTCCTVIHLRDKHHADQKKFDDALYGMNRA